MRSERIRSSRPIGDVWVLIVAAVLCAAAGSAMATDPAQLGLTVGPQYPKLLVNGTMGFQATVSNVAASGADAMDWSVANDGTAGLTLAGSGTALAAQDSVQVNGTYTKGAYGTYSVSAAAAGTNSTLGGAASGSPASTAAWVTVGDAVAAESGYDNLNSFVPGYILKSNVAAGGSYAGLSSRTSTGTTTVGTEAKLLWGSNTTGSPVTVSMNWRDRAVVETYPTMTDPPTNWDEYGLFGDVTQVQGIDGTKFVLQMTYCQDSLLVLDHGLTEQWYAEHQWIYLAWLDTSAGDMSQWHWKNAVAGNHGLDNDPAFQGLGAWSGDTTLGHWGVDIDNNTVWAVLDHNSQFSPTPEPATLALLAAGGLLTWVRRTRRA